MTGEKADLSLEFYIIKQDIQIYVAHKPAEQLD